MLPSLLQLVPVQLRHSSSKHRPPESRDRHGGTRATHSPRASHTVARHLRPQQHPPRRGVHRGVRVPVGAGALLRPELGLRRPRGRPRRGRRSARHRVARMALRQRQRRSPHIRGTCGQSGRSGPKLRLRGPLVVAVRHDYEIAANWKILVENYHECYHCSFIHPELCEVSPPTSGGDNLEPEGAWIGGPMDLYEGVETMSLDGKSHAANLPHLAAGQDRTVHYFQLFPNLLISPHPDYVLTHRLQPLAPDRTHVECEWLFSREAVETEGFDPSYASDFWDITNGQDWTACESVQRGVSSRGYRRGPLSPREDAVYQLITMVANGYLEGRVARPASRAPEAAL